MFSLGKIRTLRRARKYTLNDLAERTGFSRSYLSQIERSLVTPSLSAIDKIAEALEVPATELIESLSKNEQSKPYHIVNPENRHKLIYPGSNVANEMLTPTLNQEFEFFITHVPPGEGSRDNPYAHTGYECGYVIHGKIEFHIGDETFILEPGQSICFTPTVPHYWINIGDEVVEAVWVISPSPFSHDTH